MVKLIDLASQDLWDQMIAEKMVNVQTHPDQPLRIFNYSQNAQFSRTWNDVTLASRGLIVNDNDEIVGRPFTKFFNYGELTDDEMNDLSGAIVATDKLDGSLGIGYVNPETGKFNIATRGSFASDQAVHATQVYLNKYADKWTPLENVTYMREIIYPQNRIVLNYGDMDDLVLIGRVDNETGVSTPINEITEWKWKRAEAFDYKSMNDALAATPRDNAEGLVIHFIESDARVKIKQDDYVRLHRVVTGVTERRVWEVLKSGDALDDWLADLPEEFADFIRETANKLQGQYDAIRHDAVTALEGILAKLPDDYAQRDFALEVKTLPRERQGLVFALQKGREPDIWRLIRPEHVPLTGWGGSALAE